MSEPDWTAHILAGAAWKRFGIMVLLSPILGCVGFFIAFTALFQFFSVLANGETSEHLRRCGADLGRYTATIIDFLTYNTEQRPFPFSAQSDDSDTVASEPAPKPSSPPPPAKEKPSPHKATPRKTATRKTTARKHSTRKKTTARRKTTTTKKTSIREAPEKTPPPEGKPSE